MYHWGQVKKNNSKQTNVSRPDFYKKESGGRVFSPRYFRLFIITN